MARRPSPAYSRTRSTLKVACRSWIWRARDLNQEVALEEIDDGLWTVQYYSTVLGTLDDTTGTITSVIPRIAV